MFNVTGEIESLEVVSRPNTEFSKNNRPLKFKKVGENNLKIGELREIKNIFKL